jgi:hypothetical protein
MWKCHQLTARREPAKESKNGKQGVGVKCQGVWGPGSHGRRISRKGWSAVSKDNRKAKAMRYN